MENRRYVLEFFYDPADVEANINLKQLVEHIMVIVNIDFEKILEMFSEYPVIPQADTDKFLYRNRKIFWEFSLGWVFKHRTLAYQNNQFPFTEPDFKKVETFGNYLNSILELCYRSIDLANDVGFRRDKNNNAVSLWTGVCMEMMICSMSQINAANIGLFHGARTKEDVSKNIQKDIKMLKLRQNPYPAPDPSVGITQIGSLIDMCLKISEVNPKDNNIIKSKKSQFRNGAWKGFIDSYDRIDLKTLVDGTYSIDNDKIYFNQGGRQKKLVYPIKPSILRQSRRPKKL